MGNVTIYLPDELVQRMRALDPPLKISPICAAALEDAVQQRTPACCSRCGQPLPIPEPINE